MEETKSFFSFNSKNKDQKKETVYVEKKKKRAKEEKQTGQKKNKFRKFFYGIGKEFSRISWTTKKEMGSNFAIVLIIVVFFALVFTGISLLMILL